jgi:phage-related protein (TIGR01555 family)
MRKLPNKKTNSLDGFVENIGGWGLPFNNPFAPQNSRIDTMFINTRWALITNFRSILSEAYAEYGIVQTLVDQPVADAFRTGYTIKTDKLDDSQKRQLYYYIEMNQINEVIMEAFNWSRLYGGGGILINTDQKPDTPIEYNKIGKDSPLEFIAADMWELYTDIPMWNPWENMDKTKYFNYYGMRLDRSRVLPIMGKKAPSFIRNRLRGWGMSELERVVRSINSYLKNQDLIFELLDEAKIDVYQLNGFNTAMLTSQGTKTAERRVQTANTLKSYLNALVLDTNDKYEQKQLSFSGLSEILNQIRQGVAADLKMPLTKLFGVSAAGFDSGEDDIENYNSMIESEVRAKAKPVVITVLGVICQKLFGFIPDDMSIEFKSLRILSAEQEENMKNSKFNRLIEAVANGLATPEQFMIGCNNDNLLPVTYTQKDIEMASQMNMVEFSESDGEQPQKGKGGFLGFFKGKNYANKPEKSAKPDETGKVKEVDVTSNKFVRPDREQKPLPEETYPYKGKRTVRYVAVGK